MLEADFLTTLITTLRHPTTLAALASVGMHAGLGLLLPSFPLAAADPPSPWLGNVEVMELSPLELQHLPPLETPALALEAFPPLESLDPLEEDWLSLPPTPEETLPEEAWAGLPPGLTGDPRLYNYPLDPGAFMPIVPLPPAPGRWGPPPPSRPPRSQPGGPPPPPPRPGDAPRAGAQVPPRPNLPGVSGGDRFQIREYANPADLLPGRRPSERADETESVAARRPRQPAPAPTAPPERPRTPQELAALRQQQLEAGGAARIAEQRQQLRTDARNTSAAEVQQNEERWRQTTPQAPRSMSLAGVYPRAACLRQLSGTAIYGLTVSPNGGLGEVRLLQSAGYDIFNQQARSQVLSHRFATAEGPIPYRVSVRFDYNTANCPALTVPTPTAPREPAANPSPSSGDASQADGE